jgi:ubiquinone/menaquinone biosynthesis C-methylase UbiE
MRATGPFSILNSQFYIRLVRWAFARFYREFAWTYDTVAAAVSGGRWSMWGLAALSYLRGPVLELGCGTGNLQRALATGRAAPVAVGLDASPQMLAIAQRKLRRGGLPVRLARGVAQALPFPPASFDSIVATFPAEYILDQTTLSEAYRVLRPGGQVVVALAAAFDRDGPYERLVDLWYRISLQRSPRSAQPQPPRSLVGERLSQAGFAVQEQWVPVAGSRVHFVIGTVPERC